jgi:hypothetical protein
MALSTYGELQTAIGNWLGRPGDGLIAAVIPDWIALCEARVNRELRLRAMETRATATLQTQFVALPAGFLEMRALQVAGSPPLALEMVAPELIDRTRAGATSGRPRLFAIADDEIELAPAPDAPYAAEMVYWKRFDALSGSTPSNWLLANAPDVYLFGALAEAAAYLGDDAHWPQWEQRYQLAVKRLQDADDRGKWSGSTAAARPAEIQVA